MQLSEATKQLQAVGLTKHEAAAFVNLARLGAATAREVARASGVNRVQAYRALDSLEARGLVEVTLDRPKRYAARALREAFDLLEEERRRELAAMEQIRDSLLSAWPKIARRDSATVRLQILKGRTQIYRTLRQFVSTAKQEVLAFTTTKGLQRSYRAGVNDALIESMRRGVKSRLAAEINETNVALMKRVAEYVPLRHVDRQRARFIIVDREAILAFLIQDEKTIRGEGETALWTNSPDFVKAHLDFFEKAWHSGVAASRRIRALRGASGRSQKR